MIRRLALGLVPIAFIFAAALPGAAQTGLPTDRNSQEVRDAQKQCTAELKVKLFNDKVKKTVFGAEEEAFQRCKKITGWQSPQ